MWIRKEDPIPSSTTVPSTWASQTTIHVVPGQPSTLRLSSAPTGLDYLHVEVCDESFFWGLSEQAILDEVVARFDEAGVDLTWALTDCTYERSLVAQVDTYGSLRHWIWDHDATGEPVALPPKLVVLHDGDPFWPTWGLNGTDANSIPITWKINPYGPGGACTR